MSERFAAKVAPDDCAVCSHGGMGLVHVTTVRLSMQEEDAISSVD